MFLASISYPPIPIFHLGPLALSLHGLFAMVGFLVGAWLLLRHTRQEGHDPEKLSSALTWALVGALVGARYLTVPAQVLEGAPLHHALSPLGGSFSILGGFVGGIAAAWWRLRRLGVAFIPIADLAAPALALGTVVGRLGTSPSSSISARPQASSSATRSVAAMTSLPATTPSNAYPWVPSAAPTTTPPCTT